MGEARESSKKSIITVVAADTYFALNQMPSKVVSILQVLACLFKSRFMGFQKMALLKDEINDE